MNQEYDRLQKLIKEAEEKAASKGDMSYRNGFHIMPPTGWLNDPNGLCQLGDEYHLFFQYSPLDARGGMKAWGHYVTKDFVNLCYAGAPFVPDEGFDKNGVYSGSSYVDEQGMHIFYTGNVKLPGDHDYVNSGRRADTVLVESKDGVNFSEKRVVIDTDEYPKGYSCHIRDPKVWRENDTYYMVLGARTKDSVGQILVYFSADMLKWSLYRVISSEKPFGYMWECPDIFNIDETYVISFSPQGLDAEEYRYQNTYQSGYVLRNVNPLTDISEAADSVADMGDMAEGQTWEGNDDHKKTGSPLKEQLVIDQEKFVEWDMGFDFYAPQTFQDNSGRRILVGWAGMPDPGYENGETETENWQHCFTVPRILSVKEDCDGVRKVFQTPIKELEALRTGEVIALDKYMSGSTDNNAESGSEDVSDNKTLRLFESDKELLDIVCEDIAGAFEITINEGVIFKYDGSVLELNLSEGCGLGRRARKAEITRVDSLRLLVDSSILEIYVNEGGMVFTTRFYKDITGNKIRLDIGEARVLVYPMKHMLME
ncbi:MAG: glycoside hydrolase family 32 protein [Lachnospiraceae bacterium]|nr:glycoside hydrolase family 32 protein [Lachnospiraceae bacterium]